MDKSFDIVLWGATGFTGQLVAEYLVRQAPTTVRWALAGRNRQKLESVRQQLAAIKPEAAELPLLLGDSHDEASLDALAAQTRVICTTVGPYARYGTPLVKTCVAQGVSYCDLTGEPLWIRSNIDAFHQKAVDSGARIVHCCGFDSIPSDLGALVLQEFARERYGRYCQTVKHTFLAMRGGISGGTIASMLELVDQSVASKQNRRLLANPYNLVPGHPHDWSEQDQQGAKYDPTLGFWTAPFVMASINSRIVRRSNALLGFPYSKDFHYEETLRMPGRLAAVGMSLGMKLLMGLLAVHPVRRLLEATLLPEPGEGPSATTRENGFFKTQLIGTIAAEAEEPERRVKVDVVGVNDPGYGETAKMLGESALCLALDNLPEPGGILTPASAMGMALVKRLRAAGMTFQAEMVPSD